MSKLDNVMYNILDMMREFWACVMGKRPQGRPRNHWRDYISHTPQDRPGGAGKRCRGEGRQEDRA